MKKFYSTFIIPLISIFLMSCSSPSSDVPASTPEEPEEEEQSYIINFSINNEETKLIKRIKDAAKEFEEKTNIKISVLFTPSNHSWDEEDDLKYDMSFENFPTAKEYLKKDKIESIPDNYIESIVEECDSRTLSAFTYNDKLGAFPIGISIEPFFCYDKSLLSEEEIKNWDSILSKIDELDNGYKNLIAGFTGMEYFGAYYANGLDTTFSSDGNSDTLFSEKGLKITKGLSQLLANESMEYNDFYVADENDKFIAASGLDYTKGEITKYFSDNIEFASLPSFTFEEEEYRWSTYYVTQCLVIKKQDNAKRRDALLSFASYLCENVDLVDSFKTSNIYSVYKDSNRTISNYPFLADSIPTGKDCFLTTNYFGWINALVNLANKIKEDNGKLDDEFLYSALEEYHDAVMAL